MSEPKPSRVRRRIFAGVLAVAALCVLLAGGYYMWLTTPPPMPTTVEAAAAVLQSPRYRRLPEVRRFDYMQRAAELFDSATPEQQKQLEKAARSNPASREAFWQAVEDRIFMEVRNYVKADDFDRRQIVDRVIAMQEIAMAQRRQRPRTAERQARHERRQAQAIERLKDRVQSGNPQHQAYFDEFLMALMDRRKQMGLDPLPIPD